MDGETGNGKAGWWDRFKAYMVSLKEEMQRNSVAGSGDFESKGCCHLPESELEQRRAKYRAEAAQRSGQQVHQHETNNRPTGG